MSFLGYVFRMSKAAQSRENKPSEPIGKNFDPQIASLMDAGVGGAGTLGGWTMRHPGTWALDFATLDEMYRQPILQEPPRIRMAQVADFQRPVTSSYEAGFRVRLRDQGKEMSPAAQKRAAKIAEVLFRGPGRYATPPMPGDNGNMELAIQGLMYDSLVFDNAGFEILRCRDRETNGVYGWLPYSGKYIRRARPPREAYATREWYTEGDEPAYVQVDANGQQVAQWTRNEFVFLLRNKRNDPRWENYGWPEYDQLWSLCTTVNDAYTWNAANFKNGLHARNIVLYKTQEQPTAANMSLVIRQLRALLSQARNANRTPIWPIGKDDDVVVKNLDPLAKDMEFSNWLNFNVKLLFGGFLMDPAEGGILYGPEGQTSSLSSKGPEDRVSVSRERGLRPLLRKLSAALTAGVVQQIDPDFLMEYVGFSVPSEAERLEMDIKAMGAFKTLNEIRAVHDLPRIDSEVADLPMNQTFVNAYLAQSAQGDGEEGGGYGDGVEAPGEVPEDLQDREAPLDRAMKGTNWNDVGEWTAKLAAELQDRVKIEDRGAGVRVVVADLAK